MAATSTLQRPYLGSRTSCHRGPRASPSPSASCGYAPTPSCATQTQGFPQSSIRQCSSTRAFLASSGARPSPFRFHPSSSSTPSSSAAFAFASANDTLWGDKPEHSGSDYLVVGLAQCYTKDDASKLQEAFVIEPIPAGALECMFNGGVTSYLHAFGTNLGTVLQQDLSLLPPEFGRGRFCDDFDFRAKCSARTWKRQHAQEQLLKLVPVGNMRSDFNFSVEDKRVLNLEVVVSDDDNIKQDLSIDVYGRQKDEAEAGGTDQEIEKLYNA